MRFIGGFFDLELPARPHRSVGALWHMPAEPALTYANGRSALAALLESIRPPRIWLPAYVCPSVAEAAAWSATPVDYFPVDDGLQPDSTWLQAAARSGDVVLAVDYFGRPPPQSFRDFVKRRPDLLFLEDACHAVDTGVPPWGRWCLRSPRKLMGVPDGGFLAPSDDIRHARHSIAQPGLHVHEAACLRFEDEEDLINPTWHASNQRREASEAPSLARMSRLSRELLWRLDGDDVAARRRANFGTLADLLNEHGYLAEREPGFVPLGFPLRLRAGLRDRVRSGLIERGIFPAMHWDKLPSPAAFATAHRLAGELLTLPCDQRYRPRDMERIALAVRDVLTAR